MKIGVVPTDGMVVREDTRFAPGVYTLPNGLSIETDGVTLEGDQTLIVSPEQKGVGIRATGRKGITVRGLRLSGYYHGIRFDDCTDVTIEDVQVRGTHEIEGIDTFLYLWLPIEEVYGGAILLHNVRGGAVRNCDLQHQMNGILLYGCAKLTVERNNASFNSGWGVYLSATSDSVIADNQLDFVNRLYRRPEDGSIRAEADTAALVLVKASSRNQFLRNSCLCGGDGIFICGFNYISLVEPCNDNLFEENDCRLSPNNAVEANFSKGNIFRRNNCSRSNYGFWMGYSWENTLEDNDIEFNRFAGIASEHAHDFAIRNNRIKLNGEGVRLWRRGGKVLEHFQGFEAAYNMTLEDNTFETNRVGFTGYSEGDPTAQQCHDFTFKRNTFKDNRIAILLERVENCMVEDNTFTGNVEAGVRLVGKPDVRVGMNRFEGNAVDKESI